MLKVQFLGLNDMIEKWFSNYMQFLQKSFDHIFNKQLNATYL